MFDALKSHWEDLSTNFLNNYDSIKLFILTIQYVIATGDMETWENMYGLAKEYDV